MIKGNQITRLVKILETRGACLFHACQLTDFGSYLSLKGIPSRSCLQAGGQRFTAFETDASDQNSRVWDKVFVNLADFGKTFSKGYAGVPNPYGPILLRMRPRALLEATDVAVCLRSAGAAGFNREKEALKTVEEVNDLFEHPITVGPPQSAFIKFRKKLRETYPGAADPEISCTVPTGLFSITHVDLVVVDPYRFAGKRLLQIVEEVVRHNCTRLTFQERPCPGRERQALYSELAPLIVDGVPSLSRICQDGKASERARNWCQAILDAKLEWQFGRFANYLREGTLLPVLGFGCPPGASAQPVQPADSGDGERPF